MKDIDFANALAKGLIRFAKFVEAEWINVASIKPIGLRKQVETMLRGSLAVVRK